jgi:hypothetical protein
MIDLKATYVVAAVSMLLFGVTIAIWHLSTVDVAGSAIFVVVGLLGAVVITAVPLAILRIAWLLEAKTKE